MDARERAYVPAIHVLANHEDVDARHKAGPDEGESMQLT
jgi:hypothetical protein